MKINRGTLFILAILMIVVLVMGVTAANPWKARLRIINQTGDDIYLNLYDMETGLKQYYLRIPGVPEPDPTSTPDVRYTPQPDVTPTVTPTPFMREGWIDDNTTMFTIEREIYYARIVACGVVMDGTIDLTRNLKLNITPCWSMFRYEDPRYLGEPSMEKPNWFRAPGMALWRFQYVLPKIDLETYPNLPNYVPEREFK